MSQVANCQNPASLSPACLIPKKGDNSHMSEAFKIGQYPSSLYSEQSSALSSPFGQHCSQISQTSRTQSSDTRADTLKHKQLNAGLQSYADCVREHNTRVDLQVRFMKPFKSLYFAFRSVLCAGAGPI